MQFGKLKHSKGFSLLELLVVIAIVGILSAIAVPQYKQYVIKGNRAAAQAFMMDVSNRQQQYVLDARAYAPSVTALGMAVPPEVSKYYFISMNAPAVVPPRFIIVATPYAKKAQAHDGILSLDETGSKLPADKWK